MKLKRKGHRVSCKQVCLFQIWCCIKIINKSLIFLCHPYLCHPLWLWELFAINEHWVKLLLKKRLFISVSKTAIAKKACIGQVKMCMCFTLEIQFQMFSAVSLVSSRNTLFHAADYFSLLCHFPHLPHYRSPERCFMNGGKNNPEYLKL